MSTLATLAVMIAERDGFRLARRASPRQWAKHRSAFRRLLRSVEVAP